MSTQVREHAKHGVTLASKAHDLEDFKKDHQRPKE